MVMTWRGWAGQGAVWHGSVWLGAARSGMVGWGKVWCGKTGRGGAWHGLEGSLSLRRRGAVFLSDTLLFHNGSSVRCSVQHGVNVPDGLSPWRHEQRLANLDIEIDDQFNVQ